MHKGEKKALPKPEYFKQAQKQFAVSRRSFDRAWANAVNRSGNLNWLKPGRIS